MLGLEQAPRLHELGVRSVLRNALAECDARQVGLAHTLQLQRKQQKRTAGALNGRSDDGTIVALQRIAMQAAFDRPPRNCERSREVRFSVRR